jgi:hypothetical protein
MNGIIDRRNMNGLINRDYDIMMLKSTAKSFSGFDKDTYERILHKLYLEKAAIMEGIGNDESIVRFVDKSLTPKTAQVAVKQIIAANPDVEVILAGFKSYLAILESLTARERLTSNTGPFAGSNLTRCMLNLDGKDIDVVLDGGINGRIPDYTMYFLTKSDFERHFNDR